MDDLSRFIFWRIRCRFYPYIPPETGWRLYPTHVASLLESLEPLHIIAIGPTWIGVDGAFAEDPRSHGQKLDLAVEVADALFGEAEGKAGAGNLEVFRLSTGLTRFHLYFGSIWYVAVCADARPYPSRFAYVADPWRLYAPEKHGDTLSCIVATVDGAKVSFHVSQEFFTDPKPENARFFGDLLFLAQAGNGWRVEREVDVEYSCSYLVNGAAYIAHVLMECDGLDSFLEHAYEELLVRDPGESNLEDWRAIAKALEAVRGKAPRHPIELQRDIRTVLELRRGTRVKQVRSFV